MHILKRISPVRPAIWIFALLLTLAVIQCLSVQTLAASDAVSVQNVSISRADIISRHMVDGESSITLSDEYTAELSIGTLTMPGAYLQASITVKNENDFAVKIAGISQDTVLSEDLFFEVTTEEENLDTIEAGASAVFLVTAGWDSASTANLEYQEYGFQIVLTCEEDSVSLNVQTGEADAETESGSGSVQTGDRNQTFWWVLLILCSAAGIGLILKSRRRKEQLKNKI